MSKNLFARCSVIFVLVTLPLFATDGIAVSARTTQKLFGWEGLSSGPIMRYDIKNDTVSGSRVLYPGFGRFATINVSGTFVSFFKVDPGDTNYLSVVDVDGHTVRDLVVLPKENGEVRAWGYMDWPEGDWIYFTRSKVAPDEVSTLYRVHYLTKEVQNVLTWKYYVPQFQLSSDAKRCFANVKSGVWMYDLPGDGEFYSTTGSGCGVAISPDGSTCINLHDVGHSYIQVSSWDTKSNGISFDFKQINSWITGNESFLTNCDIDGDDVFDAPVKAGVSMTENRWSCNSDKWACLNMGYPWNARFWECNANQVLCNIVDHKSIMASHNKRSCFNGGIQTACDLHDATAQPAINEAGDFWVSGPIEEISPSLRKYVSGTTETQGNLQKKNTLVPDNTPAEFTAGETSLSVRSYNLRGRLISSSSQRTAFTSSPATLGSGVVVHTSQSASEGVSGHYWKSLSIR